MSGSKRAKTSQHVYNQLIFYIDAKTVNGKRRDLCQFFHNDRVPAVNLRRRIYLGQFQKYRTAGFNTPGPSFEQNSLTKEACDTGACSPYGRKQRTVQKWTRAKIYLLKEPSRGPLSFPQQSSQILNLLEDETTV